MADSTHDLLGPAPTPPSPAPSEAPGDTLGPYKLLERIGEGGFGSVWAAEQRTPVKRRVALKVIKLGMDTHQVIARFEAERQALAMMDHPNIARVLDAGATQTGRPYFVMELVRGVPILQYCDNEKLNTDQRLRLFIKLCHAIQHAHHKGIIHRDIKPSNILVTLHDGTPVPKVIDFGIAKATNQDLTDKTVYTKHRQMIGTPAYMAPEQAEMSGLDIDTRADIYSLGVLLYELLTGTTPFTNDQLSANGHAEMLRIIREVEPHKPSARLNTLGETATTTAARRRCDPRQLNSQLKGDLDWIAMKCLEKDRARRYDSASALAQDINRHLHDEPVLAGPPSTTYRLHKFVKRHRGRVAAAAVAIITILLGLIGTSAGMAHAFQQKQRAESAEANANARAAELELVTQFQSQQIAAIKPNNMGDDIRRAIINAAPEQDREPLRRLLTPLNFTGIARRTIENNIFQGALQAIEQQYAHQPRIQATLLDAIATTQRDMGFLDRATAPQTRALEIRRRLLGDEHPQTLDAITNTGVLLRMQGNHKDAEPLYQEALETRRRVLGENHPDTITAASNMGVLLQHQGRLQEAEPLLREVVQHLRQQPDSEQADLPSALTNLGVVLRKLNRPDQAEPLYRHALQIRRRTLGDDHPETLSSITNLAVLLQHKGQLEEADTLLREALDALRRVNGDDHPDTLIAMSNRSLLLVELERPAEGLALAEEATRTGREVFGTEHWIIGNLLRKKGLALQALARYPEAAAAMNEAHDILSASFGNNHTRTRRIINALADLHQEWHTRDPDLGHEQTAEQWRARLTQPTTTR